MGSVVHLIDASQQRDDAYRAIGRYMVEFSALIADMRNLTAGRITTAETQERELIELAFGGLMAQQVADPFFAMCRTVADLDKAGCDIEKCLREQVKQEIEERNRIAHGDWLVARWTHADLEVPTVALVRVKAADIKKPLKYENLTVSQIDEICERVEILRHVVWEFGTICTEQDSHDPSHGRPKISVSEALQLEAKRVVFRPDAYKAAIDTLLQDR
jgi:hypothetical protein